MIYPSGIEVTERGHRDPSAAARRVLFITAGGWELASSRCRVLQYLPRLGEAWTVERQALHASAWSERLRGLGSCPHRTRWQRATRRMRYHWYRAGEDRADRAELDRLARSARAWDLIYLQKVVPPVPVMARLAAAAPVVFDFDDAVFTCETERPSRPARLANVRLEEGLRRCALVITCSEFNRAYAARFAARVELLLTPVDVARYHPALRSPGAAERRVPGGVTIGWIGSASTTPYLRAAIPVLREVASTRPEVRFSFVGAEPFAVEGLPATFHRWEYETERDHLATFDIGIMPLRSTPHALGKAGYKLLQYMALGLPSVASPEGVNAEIVADGVTGFLAGDEAAWRDRLLRLIDDPELRIRMGSAARAAAESHYSVDVLFPRWRSLLEGACRERKGVESRELDPACGILDTARV